MALPRPGGPNHASTPKVFVCTDCYRKVTNMIVASPHLKVHAVLPAA